MKLRRKEQRAVVKEGKRNPEISSPAKIPPGGNDNVSTSLQSFR